MPIAMVEKPESRRWSTGEQDSMEMLFTLIGTASDTAALTHVEAETPLTYEGMIRQGIHLDPEWTDEVTDAGQWTVTVRYGLYESTFTFDTTGGSQHITQGLGTIGAYAPSGKTAPNFGGAIGVTNDNVEGVDITVPVYSFSETHYLPDEVVTPAYKATLFFLTGRVNNDVWKGFQAGEVLFLGASGSKRGGDNWEMSYRFASSPNVVDLTIGEITGIAKMGWDYLWVRYEDAEDATAKTLVKKPAAVYVERVYEWGDFSLLGIGI